jgi:hypothetical protein
MAVEIIEILKSIVVRQVSTAISNRLSLSDIAPHVRRWLDAISAHGMDRVTALSAVGFLDVPAIVETNDTELAKVLTADAMRRTAAMLNLREDWIFARDKRAYDTVCLDRDIDTLLRDVEDWMATGDDHALFAFKSGRADLDVDGWQSGALVFCKRVAGSDEHPVYAYRPVYSLHSWHEPKQRSLALRAVWATWYLGFHTRGYVASERQCDGLREGTLFAGTLHDGWGVGTWHPDDYVVRPSVEAKGCDSLAESLVAVHGNELQTTAQRLGIEVRAYGPFRNTTA